MNQIKNKRKLKSLLIGLSILSIGAITTASVVSCSRAVSQPSNSSNSTITIQKGLSTSAENSNVNVGSSYTASVEAVANDSSSLNYSWYYQNVVNGNEGEWVEIPNSTNSSTCTFTVPNASENKLNLKVVLSSSNNSNDSTTSTTTLNVYYTTSEAQQALSTYLANTTNDVNILTNYFEHNNPLTPIVNYVAKSGFSTFMVFSYMTPILPSYDNLKVSYVQEGSKPLIGTKTMPFNGFQVTFDLTSDFIYTSWHASGPSYVIPKGTEMVIYLPFTFQDITWKNGSNSKITTNITSNIQNGYTSFSWLSTYANGTTSLNAASKSTSSQYLANNLYIGFVQNSSYDSKTYTNPGPWYKGPTSYQFAPFYSNITSTTSSYIPVYNIANETASNMQHNVSVTFNMSSITLNKSGTYTISPSDYNIYIDGQYYKADDLPSGFTIQFEVADNLEYGNGADSWWDAFNPLPSTILSVSDNSYTLDLSNLASYKGTSVSGNSFDGTVYPLTSGTGYGVILGFAVTYTPSKGDTSYASNTWYSNSLIAYWNN